MTSPENGARASWAYRAPLVAAGLLIAAFVTAYGARPAVVLSTASLDDALFMKLGQALAAGKWLGHYQELTLAKGAGFPIFLALAQISGLPFPLAIALTHAAGSAFAARVFGALTRSAVTGLALLAALLLMPILYNGELLRVFRDVFYMSLTVAFVAAAIALVTGCCGRPGVIAVLTGVLGAWVWLTREEGVWLAPCVGVLLLVPLLGLDRGRAGAGLDRRARLRGLSRAGVSVGIAVALVVAFGLVNWAVYGRFVVNEIKDRAFQNAVSALQDAAAPYHREGVPVPAAARAQIYAVSPAFASLKEPILDGPLQAEATQWGCAENPKFCGDFGGGWFFWNVRMSAAMKGWHQTPTKAAEFYSTIAREVRRACADGRLRCEHWPVPMVPPMRASELGDVVRSFGKVWNVLTFGQPVALQPRSSDLSAPAAAADLALLNRPAVTGETVTLNGWFVTNGAQWFTPEPSDPVNVVAFTRAESPDLVARFNDPRLQRQRFTLTVRCPSAAPCPLDLQMEGGGATPLDLAATATGAHGIPGGQIFIDEMTGDGGERLLKSRFSRAWLEFVSRLNPVFRGLVFFGCFAYLVLVGASVVQRRISAALVVCTALLAAVTTRAVILALIDALSFTAANATYALAAVPLLLMFSTLAAHQVVALSTAVVRGASKPSAILACPQRKSFPARDGADYRI